MRRAARCARVQSTPAQCCCVRRAALTLVSAARTTMVDLRERSDRGALAENTLRTEVLATDLTGATPRELAMAADMVTAAW